MAEKRTQEEIEKWAKELVLSHGGSVSAKTIRGTVRYYLQWKEHGRYRSKYLRATEVAAVRRQLALMRGKAVDENPLSFEIAKSGDVYETNVCIGKRRKRMKNYKSLISVCIFAALANCGKSEVTAARELPNGRILVEDPTAVIGNGEKHVKTPYMIVAPDARSGFANDFTTNAISVVTEDCVNYYAHIQGENQDRTKVIHFTVDKNGIPSKTGEIIDTVYSGEESNALKMKNRTLIGVKDDFLFFFASDEYDSCFIYNPKIGTWRIQTIQNQYTGLREPEKIRNLGSYQNETDQYILYNSISMNSLGETHTNNYCCMLQNYGALEKRYITKKPINTNTFFTVINDEEQSDGFRDGTFYSGDSTGNIREGFSTTSTPIVTLPGAVSSLSNNGDEVFATTSKTNAFYNVTLKGYNVVKDENGNPRPMVPQTRDGLLRVIDNRKKNGKFLYVTSKGIHSIE